MSRQSQDAQIAALAALGERVRRGRGRGPERRSVERAEKDDIVVRWVPRTIMSERRDPA